MKKTIAKLLALALALATLSSLTACVDRTGGGSSSSSSSEPSSSSEAPSLPSSLPEPSSSEPSSGGPSSAAPTMSTDFEKIAALGTESVGWGPGYQVDAENRPVACVNLQEKYGKYDGYFLVPDSKDVYLTFDEGYENGYTPAILDTLKEKEVTAVFFITMDYAKRQPELVKRMIDEGHIVGNHSVTHPDMTTISLEKAYNEVNGLHEYVQEQFGYTMNLFRYPTGAFNEQTLAMLQQMGYKGVFWSFAYNDWDPNNQPESTKAFERITKAAHPGAIYLLHAVSKTNTELLGQVIDNIRGQGYTFAPFAPPTWFCTIEDEASSSN